MSRSEDPAGHKRIPWKVITAVATPLLAAAATAFFTGLGSNAADKVSSPHEKPSHPGPSRAQPVSYSSTEIKADCTYDTFLPPASARAVLDRMPPTDWTVIQRQPGAVFVDREIVRVSVQGESARVITLAGITFHVARKARPSGELFGEECAGPFTGRAMEVDLDRTPPRIVASSKDVNGVIGEINGNGQRTARPITFPWTVSITDPLLLYIFAGTTSCYCEWSAEIPWVSGARQGVIRVANGRQEYKVVYGAGLRSHTPVGSEWR